jgi:hypothetical protein
MRRRAFIRCLTDVLVATEPFAAKAQTSTGVRRIGYLAPGAPDTPEQIKNNTLPCGSSVGSRGKISSLSDATQMAESNFSVPWRRNSFG